MILKTFTNAFMNEVGAAMRHPGDAIHFLNPFAMDMAWKHLILTATMNTALCVKNF